MELMNNWQGDMAELMGFSRQEVLDAVSEEREIISPLVNFRQADDNMRSAMEMLTIAFHVLYQNELRGRVSQLRDAVSSHCRKSFLCAGAVEEQAGFIIRLMKDVYDRLCSGEETEALKGIGEIMHRAQSAASITKTQAVSFGRLSNESARLMADTVQEKNTSMQRAAEIKRAVLNYRAESAGLNDKMHTLKEMVEQRLRLRNQELDAAAKAEKNVKKLRTVKMFTTFFGLFGKVRGSAEEIRQWDIVHGHMDAAREMENAVQELEKQENANRQSLKKLTELMEQNGREHDDAVFAAETLCYASAAMQRAWLSLEEIYMFWQGVLSYCEALTQPGLFEWFHEEMANDGVEECAAIYTGDAFRGQMFRYICKWQALRLLCSEYASGSRDTMDFINKRIAELYEEKEARAVAGERIGTMLREIQKEIEQANL